MLVVSILFSLAALVILFWIIIYVLIKGLQYLNLDFFIHLPRPMGMAGGGVLNAIEGTIILTIMASVFAVIPGISFISGLGAFTITVYVTTLFVTTG